MHMTTLTEPTAIDPHKIDAMKRAINTTTYEANRIDATAGKVLDVIAPRHPGSISRERHDIAVRAIEDATTPSQWAEAVKAYGRFRR